MGKDLLFNTIKSVDHQNRVLEEKEAWKSLSKTRAVSKKDVASHSRDSTSRDRSRDNGLKTTLKRSLDTQKDRWAHDGYLELYPEERIKEDGKDIVIESCSSQESDSSSSSSTSSTSCSSQERKRRKRKRGHRDDEKKHKKKKSNKSHKKSRKSKRRRKD